jgi:drug/metabolite transporter (DMT)-like permease
MSRSPLIVAFTAALLFGAATPASKALLNAVSPFQLAGLLYLGAAMGVVPLILRERRFSWPWALDRKTKGRLLGAICFGGILGPVFLLFGLRLASAASVSLWLNLELIATVLLGYFLFQDHLGLHGWMASAGTLSAAALLSMSEGSAGVHAGILVALACICWGLDNHLTALIDGITPVQTTFWKGVMAGSANLAIGILAEPYTATIVIVAAAAGIGVFSYGISIVLYIVSAQRLGATRSQIIFSSAPFFGVILSAVLLGESISGAQITAIGVITVSLSLLFFEQHHHKHRHEAVVHEHPHRHDDGHHDHAFPGSPPGLRHSHRHAHTPLSHAHSHWPDLFHRHKHDQD